MYKDGKIHWGNCRLFNFVNDILVCSCLKIRPGTNYITIKKGGSFTLCRNVLALEHKYPHFCRIYTTDKNSLRLTFNKGRLEASKLAIDHLITMVY